MDKPKHLPPVSWATAHGVDCRVLLCQQCQVHATSPQCCHVTNDAPVIQCSHPAYEPLLVGWIVSANCPTMNKWWQQWGDDKPTTSDRQQTSDQQQTNEEQWGRHSEQMRDNKWQTNRGQWRQTAVGMMTMTMMAATGTMMTAATGMMTTAAAAGPLPHPKCWCDHESSEWTTKQTNARIIVHGFRKESWCKPLSIS